MTNINILYIEDDAAQRTAFEAEAVLHGFSVLSAGSGKEGLLRCNERAFDAVLCDLNMPEMDGLEVLKSLKESCPTIPFFVMTAHGSISQAVQAIKEGAEDFILKPIDFDLISNSITKSVEKRSMLEELANKRVQLDAILDASPNVLL